jgi:hypothetical protein
MRKLIVLAGTTLILLLTLLVVSHRAADAQDSACFDELLVRWNEFAEEANRHVHLVEAQPADRDRTHRRLDRQWQALRALGCW